MATHSTYEQVLLDRRHEDEERKRIKRKSILLTLLTYGVLALSFIMVKFGPKDPPYEVDNTGAVGVMLGNQDEGMGDVIQPVAAGDPGSASASEPYPLEAAPAEPSPATEEGFETADDPESAPVTAPTRPQNTPRPSQPSTPASTTPTRQTPTYQGPTFQGSDNGDGGHNGQNPEGGASDGFGNREGDHGITTGDDSGPGGLGPGGFTLNGRQATHKPSQLNRNFTRQGKVVIAIYVDRQGNVRRTDPAPGPGTTVSDPATIDQIRAWAKNWKFTAIANGPEEQKGYVEYIIHY